VQRSVQLDDADEDLPLLKATRELRARLKLSQTDFGQRIHRTITTVVRYEKDVAPKGEALVPYVILALDSGFEDLAALFRAALIRDLGSDCERALAWKADSRGTISVPDEIRPLVRAFLKFMSARDLMPAEELARNGLKSLLLKNYSSSERSRK